MSQLINVKRNKDIVFAIDKDVFTMLFENTIVHRSKDYLCALKSEDITFHDFINLSRKGEVPYPIFDKSQGVGKIAFAITTCEIGHVSRPDAHVG